ncbi:hypothetical protein CA984_23805 [Streptosporangium minutum]|uniref:Uncharacterized protein n=1 Tax=Streptosporangium minutum TaxID=569862 RepID=A0A243RH21_9ACTN|nr:hypothetical protein CA984_23805 [Streptosporangium minutum]
MTGLCLFSRLLVTGLCLFSRLLVTGLCLFSRLLVTGSCLASRLPGAAQVWMIAAFSRVYSSTASCP